jgi:hypothetical protein
VRVSSLRSIGVSGQALVDQGTLLCWGSVNIQRQLTRGNRPAGLAIRTGGCCDGDPYLAAEETDRLSLEDLIARSCFGNRLLSLQCPSTRPIRGVARREEPGAKIRHNAGGLGIIREGSSGRAPQDQLESLLAVGIMILALSGAVFGPLILQLTGVRDRRAVGLALGCASIAVGTARAFEIDSTAGAFASVGMNLTAICAGFVLPWLPHLI